MTQLLPKTNRNTTKPVAGNMGFGIVNMIRIKNMVFYGKEPCNLEGRCYRFGGFR
jgi:hypothetical protein